MKEKLEGSVARKRWGWRTAARRPARRSELMKLPEMMREDKEEESGKKG